jgi:hypothetical protein
LKASVVTWPSRTAPTDRSRRRKAETRAAERENSGIETAEMSSLNEIEAKLINTGETQISLAGPHADP